MCAHEDSWTRRAPILALRFAVMSNVDSRFQAKRDLGFGVSFQPLGTINQDLLLLSKFSLSPAPSAHP